jgi:hypothetical protein
MGAPLCIDACPVAALDSHSLCVGVRIPEEADPTRVNRERALLSMSRDKLF